jgi:glycosyltransferase involved in cell wall biosynthesis
VSDKVGVGEPTDDYACKYLRTLIAACVGSNQSDRELAELYREASVYVGPSLSELGFNSVFEAAASGLACIVSDRAGSLIRGGIEGFVVPAGDITALKITALEGSIVNRSFDRNGRSGA